MDALLADSDMVIQNMKACYGALKEAIAKNASEETKKQLMDDLTNAVQGFDSQMKKVKKATPSSEPSAKAKAKPAAKKK